MAEFGVKLFMKKPRGMSKYLRYSIGAVYCTVLIQYWYNVLYSICIRLLFIRFPVLI